MLTGGWCCVGKKDFFYKSMTIQVFQIAIFVLGTIVPIRNSFIHFFTQNIMKTTISLISVFALASILLGFAGCTTTNPVTAPSSNNSSSNNQGLMFEAKPLFPDVISLSGSCDCPRGPGGYLGFGQYDVGLISSCGFEVSEGNAFDNT